MRRYAVVATLVGLVVVFSIAKPDVFFTTGNLQTILTTQATLLTLALSLTVPLAAGELDLSVGGMLGLSTVLIAHFSTSDGALPGLALGISVLVAVIVGGLNAFLIVGVGVNGFIATLAMGTLLFGVSEAVSGSMTIGNVPAAITAPMQNQFLGIGLPFWYAVGIGLILWYALANTPSGRHLYFTGEGREAARLAGIRVGRIRAVSLLVSALGAWLAGFILVGQTGATQAGVGDSYLLPAYAAVFLGAAATRSGRFSPLGTATAVLLLAVGSTGLQLFGLANWVTDAFNGAILIAAITLATLGGTERRGSEKEAL